MFMIISGDRSLWWI